MKKKNYTEYISSMLSDLIRVIKKTKNNDCINVGFLIFGFLIFQFLFLLHNKNFEWNLEIREQNKQFKLQVRRAGIFLRKGQWIYI